MCGIFRLPICGRRKTGGKVTGARASEQTAQSKLKQSMDGHGGVISPPQCLHELPPLGAMGGLPKGPHLLPDKSTYLCCQCCQCCPPRARQALPPFASLPRLLRAAASASAQRMRGRPPDGAPGLPRPKRPWSRQGSVQRCHYWVKRGEAWGGRKTGATGRRRGAEEYNASDQKATMLFWMPFIMVHFPFS